MWHSMGSSSDGSFFERKGAAEFTRTANAESLKSLPFMDKRDFEDAKRGFVAPLPDGGVVKNEKGQIVWDLTRFSFIKEGDPAPDTVHPSLWRQAQLVTL
jgi:alkyl sulfatase BDS1-like metallo-beta-lactamase superfamily hydrolase